MFQQTWVATAAALMFTLGGATMPSLATAAEVTATPTPAASSAGARPRIEKAADLPRFTYPVSGPLEPIVRDAARFAPLAAAIRRDTESVLAGYDIPDKATRRDLIGLLAALDYLDGRYDQALARAEQVRALQDKPADKLLSGLRLRAMAQAAKQHGPQGEAFQRAVATQIRRELDAMPYAVIENDIKSAKMGVELVGEALVLGRVREVMQPIVDKSGALSSDFAPALVNARLSLLAVLPLKAVLTDTYTAYLAAHQVQKPDIWAARDVTLTPAQIKQPVTIAVWDSGVDTALFGRQVVKNAQGQPAVIAFDKYSRPATGELMPIPQALQSQLPQMKARTKGFSDLQSNIDSPEASEVKRYLSTLQPDQYKAAVEQIGLAGNYEHGTHVAGIALAGNPGARLVVGRIEFGWTLKPDPCPSREQTERDAQAYQSYVDYFKQQGVRVVNMSWGGNVSAIENDLEQCGLGKTPEERKATARELFEIGKTALTRAFASAPEILFVTAAGNSNSDASFVEDIPAGIVLPNLLTVGAVDRAGDEAPFTSYGPTVKVHANGYQVESFLPGGDRVALSGTSMASPQVANLAGKLLAVNPALTPQQLINLIVGTAERTPDGRRVLIDPKKALAAAQALPSTAGSTAATTAVAAVPAAGAVDFPRYQTVAQVQQACDSGLAGAGQRLKALEQRPADGGWLAAADALNAYIEDQYYPIGFLSNVHPDSAVRDAMQACEQRWQSFYSSYGLNEKIYRALKALPPGDAIDQRARALALEGFEDSGVALPAALRPQAKRLNDRIGELGLAFDKAVRDNKTRVRFTPDELKGVPEANWKNAPRDAQGRVVLGLDTPSYLAVLNNAESPAARERMYRAKLTEGGPANLKRLQQLVALRTQYAGLFGYKSYDDFVLRRRMTGSLERTQAFLDEVKAAVTARERADVEELRAAKAAHTGRPLAETKVDRWDVFFYTERLRRERYSVDQEAFRPYFPPQESLRFVMKVAERMFGVRHERIAGAELWHPDAQAWAVVDAQSGQRLATLLIDLYPRDGKYNHAAVWPLRGVSTASGRQPMAALVVNLDRQGLSLEEMETLLHEFGHALHNNLSQTRYTAQAGTSVLHDFVEAPSQMLEDWVYDPGVMALMQQVCSDCKPVPEALLRQAREARDYGKGITYARQHLYAAYDLALYGPRPGQQPVDPQALWARMEGATPVGHVKGTMLPASFGHIAGGYAAGYYGYLYSLVVAMDLRTAFEGHRLDPAVGQRYRSTVLARGGEVPPLELVRGFLGRDTNAKAFFDDLKK